MSSPFGTRSAGGGTSALSGLLQAAAQVLRPAEQRGGARVDRGDVRAAVLGILAEQPMHGYRIVRTLEERSGGAPAPRAGSVYPALQLLVDEGLATAAEEAGRKTYTLTAPGRVAAEAAQDCPPQRGTAGGRSAAGPGAMTKAGARLAQVAATVAVSGTAEQVAEAAAVLDDARRRLYAILARS